MIAVLLVVKLEILKVDTALTKAVGFAVKLKLVSMLSVEGYRSPVVPIDFLSSTCGKYTA